MRTSLSILIGLLTASLSFAQGNVQVLMDPSIEQLIEKRLELNKRTSTMHGYRIQIYYGSERSEAQAAKERFEAMHPAHEAYLIYQPPYFKVRAGDFRTKREAYPLYHELSKEYESAFIVEEDIRFPKLAY